MKKWKNFWCRYLLALLWFASLLISLDIAIYLYPVRAATIRIPASSDYSGGGEYSSITVSGGNSVSISDNPLAITGPGGTAGMFNPRNGALTVKGTTLTLGGPTNPKGGTFAAQVILAGNGHLAINSQNSTTSWSLGDQNIVTTTDGTGTLTLQGTGSLVNVGAIGASSSMLARIAMIGDIRLALRNGLWARDIRLDGGAQITLQQRNLDLPVDSSIYMNDGSRIWVQKGTSTVGNVRLGADIGAPIDWLIKNNVLESWGDLNILGQLVVDHGLGSVISHYGNIIFAAPQGEIETNGGQLHLEALNGKIVAHGGMLPVSGNITALEVDADAINCKNLTVKHVIGHTLNVHEDVKVDTFSINVDGATIGGNLVLSDLRNSSSLGKIFVGGNVTMASVGDLNFDELMAGGNIAVDGGNLYGGAMGGKNFTFGSGGAVTNLAVKRLAINSRLETDSETTLQIGSLVNSTNFATRETVPESAGKTGIFVKDIDLRNSSVESHGQEISVENGSVAHTSLTATAGDINSSSLSMTESSLVSANDLTFGAGSTFAGKGNFIGAAHDVFSRAPLSGEGLLLYSGNTLTAPELSAAHVETARADIAGNAEVTASFAASEAMIGSNLKLTGAPYAYAAFNTLNTDGDILLRDATMAAGNASARKISLSGAYPTEFNVINLASGSNLNVGENGYATIGLADGAWILSKAPSSATHGALGIKKPLRVNSLQVNSLGARASGIDFGPQSFLLVDGPAALETATPAGAISATNPLQANIAEGARIAFSGDIRPNNVYVVLGQNIITRYASARAWDDSNLASGSHLISLKKIADRPGSFIAASIPSSDVYPDLDGSLGGIVDDAINRPGVGGAVAPPSPGTGIPELPQPTPGAPAVPGQGSNLPGHPSVPGVPDESFPGIPGTPDPPAYPGDSVIQEPNDGSIGTGPWHLNSSLGGTRFLSRITSTLYMDHDYRGAIKTLESSARMAILGAVPQMVYAANNSATEAARGRASFTHAPDMAAVNVENDAEQAFDLWIMPLFKSMHGFDLHANNWGYDFSGNMGGFVAGADLTFGEFLRAGLDVSMGGGYAQSGGDLARTTNKMGFWGAGLYSGLRLGQLGLSLDVQYTGSSNDLRQELSARLQMSDLCGDLTASALSSEMRAEYRLPLSQNWKLVPHACARYAWIHVDGYTFYSDGAVLDGASFDQQIWSFPFGMGLEGNFGTESDWRFSPILDLQAMPIAGNVEARLKVHYIGTRSDAQIYTQTMDYITVGGCLGLEAVKGDFRLGAKINVQGGLRGSSQSILASFCYEF